MVWAGAWLGPTLPTVYHRLVVGGENGHGFSRGENPWFSTAGWLRRRASLQLMYVLWRSKLRLRLHCRGVAVPLGGCPVPLCVLVLCGVHAASKEAKASRVARWVYRGVLSRLIRLWGVTTCTKSASKATEKAIFIRTTFVVSGLHNVNVPCGHKLCK